MLVLTLKEGQSLHISDNIEVTLNSVDGRRARVSVVAPKSIPVLRDNAKVKRGRTVNTWWRLWASLWDR